VTYGWPGGCADAPAILAPALQSARLASSPEYLYALAAQAADVRDASVFSAALALADDAGATLPARAAALLVILAQFGNAWDFPGVVRSALLTDPLPSSGICGPALFGWEAATEGTPLPSDAGRQAARVFDRLIYGAGTPTLLRNLARCSRGALGADIPPQVDLGQVQLTYVCGNTFRIQNPTSIRLVFSFLVEGPAPEGYDVPVGGNSHADFDTDGPGTVRLLYDGTLVTTRANGGLACP
jgi:hypothetical protein